MADMEDRAFGCREQWPCICEHIAATIVLYEVLGLG